MIYLLQVYTLKKLPGSFLTLLSAPQFIKVGCGVRNDLSKLSRDFPEFTFPPKESQSRSPGLIELGTLAKSKNAVSTANASLAAIAYATLHVNISKELCSTDWSASTLSSGQIEYAALDAWIGPQILNVLKDSPTVGLPLESASPVGQAISLFVQKQEVARGFIIEQDHQYPVAQDSSGNPVMINVSTTKTRVLIRIDEVLAPSYILTHHKKSLEDLKGDLATFNAVVNLGSL